MDPYGIGDTLGEIEKTNTTQQINYETADSDGAKSPGEHSIFSENDISFETVSSLPTPLKQPRYSSDDTVDGDRGGSGKPKKHTSVPPGAKFVAVNDVPKRRTDNTRFNPIRPSIKSEESDEDIPAAWFGKPPTRFGIKRDSANRASPSVSTMYRQSVGEVTDEEMEDDSKSLSASTSSRKGSIKKAACGICRAKMIRCTHNSSTTARGRELPLRSDNGNKPKIERDAKPEKKLKIKTEPNENRVKKDGTPYLRNPHDRTKGLSMTKSAVDYRERKVIQQQYQDRMASLLDEDIVNQVEEEGGITPLGRLFKAGVRMLERVQLERAGSVETPQAPPTQRNEEASANRVRQKTIVAVTELEAFKGKLQDLLDGRI